MMLCRYLTSFPLSLTLSHLPLLPLSFPLLSNAAGFVLDAFFVNLNYFSPYAEWMIAVLIFEPHSKQDETVVPLLFSRPAGGADVGEGSPMIAYELCISDQTSGCCCGCLPAHCREGCAATV